MNAEEYLLLYEKYISGNCSPEETERLYAFNDGFELINGDHPSATEQESGDRIRTQLQEMMEPPVRPLFPYPNLFKIAAVLLVTAGLGFFFYQRDVRVRNQDKVTLKAAQPIVPGRPSATLTLANGTTLNLNDVKNGVITSSASLSITKSDQQSICYTSAKTRNLNTDEKNTITVPRGGSYTINLPDGTKVWMNSASALTYPVNFSGKTRTVQLRGEAYFEVAKNKALPFIVESQNTKVEVLGTHFNVKAYENDPSVQTTLLEGSVRFSNAARGIILKPGEQGEALRNNAQLITRTVNTNQAMSWKNGYFMFQESSVTEIMDQISRWYDVDVEIRGDLDQKTFGGIYSRNKDINELLKGLELTGLVHFKIEGRKIIVTQ